MYAKQAHIILFLLLVGLPTLSWSQACCSGGTPLAANLGVAGIDSRQLALRLTYDYNTQRDLVSNTRKLDDDRRTRNTHAVLLQGRYGFSKRWSGILIFSWVRQEEENQSLTGASSFTKAEGIGDLIGLLQYEALAKGDWRMQVAGGLKAPLGRTDVADELTGFPLNADMQPGTGSWDVLGVLNLSRENLFKPGLTLITTATYRLTTEDLRFEGQQRYEFGNEWQILFGFSDQYVLGPRLFYPQLMVRYRQTAIDLTNGFNTPNTGGEWVHLVPGFQLGLNEALQLNFAAELPVFRKLRGTQLTTSYRMTAGMTYNLNL
ncbi:MAG: hypothetical protein AAGG75_16595 [Bacteroidota bacterium]